MQHMGVVKDFLIPADGASATRAGERRPTAVRAWRAAPKTITWTASGVSSVKLEYTLNGSTWRRITSSTAASAGSYAWTVPTSATHRRPRARERRGQRRAHRLERRGLHHHHLRRRYGQACSSTRCSPTSRAPTSTASSWSWSTAAPAAVDLSGWTLSDATSVRHTFASGTSLAAGASVTVFGAAAGIPARRGQRGGRVHGVARPLQQRRHGDAEERLRHGHGRLHLRPTLAGTDGVSANRSPDDSSHGTFVLHTTLSSLLTSPGKQVNGTAR